MVDPLADQCSSVREQVLVEKKLNSVTMASRWRGARDSLAALMRSQRRPAAQNQPKGDRTKLNGYASPQGFVRFLVSPLLVPHPSQFLCMRGSSSNHRNARAAHVEAQ
jgi:hypothetical protein